MRIKNILAVIICSFILNKTNAQVSDESRYEFGLRISPQISWSSPDSKSLENDGGSLDWNYGFHVAKKFTSRYAIAFEVNVINMTSKIKFSDSLNIFSSKISNGSASTNDLAINYILRYVQVPIIFKMYTDEFKDKWRVYGEFGVGLSFLVRSKADVNSSVLNLSNVDVDNPDTVDEFFVNSDKFNENYSTKVNFLRPSFIIGGGVLYDLFGQTKGYVGLRYDGGLVDYMDADKWIANNSFTSLNLGIIF
jgi:hypothetical protein